VNITVERATDQKDAAGKEITEDKDFELVRAVIQTATVKGWRKLGAKEDQWDWMVDRPNKIGYVRLLQFTDGTTDELRAAIKQMKADAGGLNGLILDLRYNPGGLLTEAVSVSNTFIDKGTIVSTEGTMTGEVKSAIPGESLLGKTPLVVLINESSASASEIVSGAIRHYADKGDVNAVLIGQRSFGKGSVQNVWNLAQNSKMKLTTQYYKLPDGRIIHKKPGMSTWGVDPHLKVSMLPEQESDALKTRQDADVLPIDKDGKLVESKTPRPDPQKLIDDGLDVQLETALIVLQSQVAATPEQALRPQ
jgi:carboxyl-terminal processing protease